MKICTRLSLAIAATLLLNNTAMAITYTFDDTWKDWPGYATALSGTDVYGTPSIKNMSVTLNDTTGSLTQVKINFDSDRLLFDTLFINTSYAPIEIGGAWDDWDYVVRTPAGASLLSKMYSVNNPGAYTYTLSKASDGGVRIGTPNGIEPEFLVDSSLLGSVSFASNTLTYDFNSGINLHGGFFIAYGPYCGNDVIGGGSPVPEPATMLLFGAGIVGLAGLARRRKEVVA